MASMNDLSDLGQSVWLDYIRRDMVRSGELEGMIANGLRGLTSNPSIFQKAISTGEEYDEDLHAFLQAHPDCDVQALFESVALEDIREACDRFLPVHDGTGGRDGFVSLEVSPHLADDTERTLTEARRLWAAVARPNLMIKVPSTPAGIPAIQQLLSEGVNVNITLMFSLAHYEAVANAFLAGIRACRHPERLASVASFFVSRVDTKVDKRLDAMGTAEARALRGRAAVANAKLAYARYREVFHGEAFRELEENGVQPQRVLFGSTSTKDPAYSDVKYVEELIGPETVNTLPLETIEAFEDHGEARESLTEDLGDARRVRDELAGLGIDLLQVGEELQREGVKKFADAYDDLMKTLEGRRSELTARSG